MLKLFNKALNNQKGFTLVELMVVVVIIGILVAIIIPIYGNVQDNAAMKAHEANLRTIDGAIGMYMAENGQAPEDIDALLEAELLAEEPIMPKRINAQNASKFLEGTYPADGKYTIEPSTQASGEAKAFPAPASSWDKDAYRKGDTPATP